MSITDMHSKKGDKDNCNVIAYTGAMMYFVSPILRIEQG